MSASIPDLARFFDALPHPCVVVDRDLNIVAANTAYLALVNRERSDIVGRWAWDAFSLDDETLRRAIDSFELVKRTGKPDTMALLRFDVPTAGGPGESFEKRCWSITHTPVLDGAGEVEFVLQHPIDVTALEILRQTGEASRGDTGLQPFRDRDNHGVTRERVHDEALRRYENIVQSDTAPICAFDSEYRQIAFNRAHSDDFFRTYGHRVQLGEVFPDLLLPEQASMIRSFIDRALAGEMFTVTAEVGDPDLTVPHWELSYGPLRAADGIVVGAFHHAKDISARVRMQAELLQTQEVLRQAQKMEAIGQLTGGIAHDFNNLLGGMSAALQVLQARLKLGKFEGVERYIGMAQDSIKRASALTQRLLAFARRQTLDSKPVDVNRLLNGLEDLIRRSVGPDVKVEVIGSGRLWTTRVDASQLENSVINLCINARDAMLPAGGRLTIETANKWFNSRTAAELEMPPGPYVSVCVTDTGSGMSQEVAQRIFEPFFTTKPLGQGTGLGLSMVYGFVRQSGGQVRVYSELNKGTTMCLYLPRHQGEPEAELSPGSSQFVGGGEGESIVLIEDEETIRIVVSEVLVEAGYSVATAEDGPSGLRILEKTGRVDCLITDVGLPGGLNGRQVADAARRSKPDLKILFITGYAENAAVGDGHLDRGMEVLTKPFDVGALVAKLRQMLNQ